MKVSKLIILFLIFSICGANKSFSGGEQKGTSTALFLRIAPGARPSGMGGAFAGISNDINSLYWNPAGATQIPTMEFTATHMQWIADISNSYVAFAYPIDKNVLGVSLTHLSMSDMEIRNDKEELQTGNSSISNSCVSLMYARKITGNFNVGLNMKSITQQYGDYRGTGMAFELGLLVRDTNFSVGINIQNLGTEIKTEDVSNSLPLNLKIGFGYKPMENLNIGLDIDNPRDSDFKIHTGAELVLREMFALRAGYDQVDKVGFDKGLSLGLGIKTTLVSEEGFETESKSPLIHIDYAAVAFGEFGYTHRFSISFEFK